MVALPRHPNELYATVLSPAVLLHALCFDFFSLLAAFAAIAATHTAVDADLCTYA
jgi:hypothetical protein